MPTVGRLFERFLDWGEKHRSDSQSRRRRRDCSRFARFVLGASAWAWATRALNDHDDLRTDPLLAALVGKTDSQGNDRLRLQDRGQPLAGKSTLNRLELTPPNATASRYKKVGADGPAIERLSPTAAKPWPAAAATAAAVVGHDRLVDGFRPRPHGPNELGEPALQ